MNRLPLDFERLDVYRLSIDFLGYCVRVTSRMPRGQADLRDQLRRAATSIPLNIAEGTGKRSGAERAHHYTIARGSALECGAILDVLASLGVLPPAEAEQGKVSVSRIVSMLSKMCR
jgi:four helix bundle protein